MTEQGPAYLIRNGAVAEIVLNRPERKNAVTGPLVAAVRQALAEAEADEGVRAVILRGAGGSFCSGLDLKEFNAEPRPEWAPGFQAGWRGLHQQLFDFPKPVICALEGYAINAGSALALAADFLVTGREAFLQVGEVRQGRPAPMNLAWLRFKFGDAITRRVTLLGRRIPGPELERLGIAFQCVDDAAVLDTARAIAAELAEMPPAGLATTKAALRALDLPGGPNSWFELAGRAVAGAAPAGPIPSLKR
ncbi:MAG: enoyl-CoA hydratase/isomerase family protein [Chloroflexi bacterium]|nr:enoyl-CoA hydratase/isomerase family protein [Chloroflexota bacterium]